MSHTICRYIFLCMEKKKKTHADIVLLFTTEIMRSNSKIFKTGDYTFVTLAYFY